MCAMGAPMEGRLIEGKFSLVLESSGALKSEKCRFLAVIFFLFNPVPMCGFYRHSGVVY